MNKGCKIVDAANTYNLALSIVQDKGYKLFFLPSDSEFTNGYFIALKGSRQFIGDDPLRVLGLITLWENTGDDWQNHIPEIDYYDKVMSWALPDTVDDYNKLSDTEFNQLIADYRLFFEEVMHKGFPENPNRQDMFNLMDAFYVERDECD
jgi:hypothetical protein